MKTTHWIFGFLLISSSSLWAGVGSSFLNSAPVLQPGQIEVKFASDVIFNQGGGFNIVPRFRTGLVENYFDFEAFAGTGTTNFQIGAGTKFNLLPDIHRQVALSFAASFSYIRDDDNNDNMFNLFLTTLTAVASKRFSTHIGNVEPYADFQTEFLFYDGQSTVPLHLGLGSKWHPKGLAHWKFLSEFQFNLRRGLWLFGLGAGYNF